MSGTRRRLPASDNPPPDPGFGSRVRAFAEACEQQARSLKAGWIRGPGLVWTPEPDAREMVLSYELRPAATRPGPAHLWQRFDSAVQLLGIAKEGLTMSLVAAGYAEVAVVMHEIADALEAHASPPRRRKSTPPCALRPAPRRRSKGCGLRRREVAGSFGPGRLVCGPPATAVRPATTGIDHAPGALCGS